MSEKRAYRRYEVDLLDITIAVIEANNMEIIDISLNGIALHANRRLNIGEQYNLKILSKDKALTLRGVVIWSKISGIQKVFNGDTIPAYSAGLEYVVVSKYLRDDINNFIETHKTDNYTVDDAAEYDPRKDLRRYPRFQVNTPVEAFIIDNTQYHPVKDLSFGGVSVECKRPMKINSTMPMMLNLSEDKFIVFRGRIVSCCLIKRSSPRVYTMGIAFSEMSTKARKMLTEYIRLLSDIDKSPSQ